MNAKQTIKGFTIIEVVLVLAIAGLIFLMVFIALPALQSGQRDTARKQDIGNLGTAVNNYSSANRGALPPNAAALGTINTTGDNTGYLTSLSKNVTSITLTASGLTGTTTSSRTVSDGVVNIVTSARCVSVGAGTATIKAGTARQYVMMTRLESGGGTGYCQDS